MTGQQEALLQELRKEENNEVPVFDLSTIPLDNEIPFAQQRLRLKAWTRLFTLSEESLEGAAFISPSPDAVEALLEHYRQKYAETKQQLLLPLPAFLPEQGDDALAQREHFQEEAAELLTGIREFLAASTSDPFFSKEAGSVWDELLEKYYPEAKHGRSSLTLYFLPEINPQQLFLETFAAQDQLATRQPAETAGTVVGCIKGSNKVGLCVLSLPDGRDGSLYESVG
ncbi:MAG: hypothetical protein D3910_05910 [Candidatus Electrothrix sp. ATG2]|nr:hypothetical protein [Candidatus Electrothrix sp. ATG2]